MQSKRDLTDLFEINVEQGFRFHLRLSLVHVSGADAALAVRPVSAVGALLTVIRERVVEADAISSASFSSISQSRLYCASRVREARRFIWKIRKPVDHLDLLGSKGLPLLRCAPALTSNAR